MAHYRIDKRQPPVPVLSPRHCEILRNIVSFYGKELLAPWPGYRQTTLYTYWWKRFDWESWNLLIFVTEPELVQRL